MSWENIVSEERLGAKKITDLVRSPYERDYDRIIFSSPFRRLQNKTQIFPLPGATFVHNRLTHTLEVASIGRSLGQMIGKEIKKKIKDTAKIDFYQNDLGTLVSAACLGHDIGNPAFGHSGEKAISNYFVENAALSISGKELKERFTVEEWGDLTNFEGNANALRILSNKFKGKSDFGLDLTVTTLAAMIKYPCDSLSINESDIHTKKYGFFQSEKDTFLEICQKTNMIGAGPTRYKRHPFVFIVEAADDISNKIIDIEDAHRLKIISTQKVAETFVQLIRCLNLATDDTDAIKKKADGIVDDNEQIAYLRSKCINSLILKAFQVFFEREEEILSGALNNGIMDIIESECTGLEDISTMLKEKVYTHQSVLEIEISGFNVMSSLLQLMIPALLKETGSTAKDKKVLGLIPEQFKNCSNHSSAYEKVLCAIDFISGMTDVFASEFYRKLYGIEISKY